MKERIDRLEDKIDKVSEVLVCIDKTLVKQEENLKEHMRRTNLLEQALEPVENHVSNVTFLFKFFTGCIAILGVLIGILKLFL